MLVRYDCAMLAAGSGSYGHVQLVRNELSGETFALKGVMKKEIVECGQVQSIATVWFTPVLMRCWCACRWSIS